MSRYQIALSSPAGIEPQKYEIYNTKEEAQEIVDRYNEQNDNPYCEWIILERK